MPTHTLGEPVRLLGMSLSTLNHVSVGRPITKFGISIFPVYQGGVPELTQSIIRPNDLVLIREKESPTVPTLVVENKNSSPVVLFVGETLEGGRQQRVLNQTVVLPPFSETAIPVSCVEQGRWHGSQQFGGIGRMSPSNVRRSANRGYQHEVWNEVSYLLSSRSVDSDTQALADLYRDPETDAKRRNKIEKVASWGPLPGQTGIVVTHRDAIQSLDLFGSPEFLAAMWPKMVESALGTEVKLATRSKRQNTSDAVLKFLDRVSRSLIESSAQQSTGLGNFRRIENEYFTGQALTLDGALVHASAFPSAD